MSENIELLKRIVSNYSERHRNDEEKINWLYKERKKQTLEIFSLEKELAALREKCRWRPLDLLELERIEGHKKRPEQEES